MANHFISGLSDGMRWFIGTIEDRGTGKVSGTPDKLKIGRVKVRIYGMHGDDVKSADLPWAHIMTPSTSASISGMGASPTGMVEGTICVGFFVDGVEGQEPCIMGTLPHIQFKKRKDT
mgnify:CR=1 FL=1|jgi:hypothetical protein